MLADDFGAHRARIRRPSVCDERGGDARGLAGRKRRPHNAHGRESVGIGVKDAARREQVAVRCAKERVERDPVRAVVAQTFPDVGMPGPE